ncbi:hypothetical protein HZA76_02935 [Candidatus Roizmanbacteria bacterium]|nr:hypothetical protein [Candidatus Roizmanbacteria bacterium]
MKNLNITKRVARFISIFIMAVLFSYLYFQNLAPLGVRAKYSLKDQTTLLTFRPKKRVITEKLNGQIVHRQIEDFLYFETPSLYDYDSAIVKIQFYNPYPNQDIILGFQDKESWHYKSKYIDSPYLNDLPMVRTGNEPYLFQKQIEFNNINTFFSNFPKDKVIGIFDFDNLSIYNRNTTIEGYKPALIDTVIDTPLRGRHVFYAYLDKEPFKMTVTKQDLNWYEDPDVLDIKIYKENDKVYEAVVDDDGVSSASHKVMPSQEVTIENPGPDLPESGVYKIVFEATEDIIIKSIRTNLHKLVFEGKIFPVANTDVYPKIIDKSSATNIITNSKIISALTHHKDSTQSARFAGEEFNIDKIGIETTMEVATESSLLLIDLSKSDLILKGFLGYFSFSPEQFFKPTENRILPINSQKDAYMSDFIITNYHPSLKAGDWRMNEYVFDLDSKYVKDNNLSWIIKAPGLKDDKRSFLINDIEVTLIKKPFLEKLWKK